MPELKTLQDFYDPTKTGLAAMQVLQGQQHMDIQQQQLANQQRSVDQQGRNLEVDNLQKALQTADPMQSYPIYQQLHEKLGLPVQPVNDYYANLPHAKVLAGAKELNVKAGVGDSPNLAALTAEKPAIQTQFGNAAAQSPLQQEQLKALQLKTQEHTDLAANLNTQINALLPVTKSAGLGIERAVPHVEALSTIQQEYDKNAKSLGLSKAAKMKQERIATNPALQQFNERRTQSIPQIEQQVQQIEDQQAQLETRAELLARGVAPLNDGESLHVLAGTIDASHQHLAYAKAQLAFAKNPSPANMDALRTVKSGMDTYINNLTEKKNSSQDALDIRRDAQQETARKNQYGEKLDQATAKGQALLLDAVNKGESMNVAAARIAKQFSVSPADLKKALTDPDKPTTQINLTQEKKENQVVGEGLGQQYLETQKAGRAAMATLTKLDRMDTLLTGVTTGKLTPGLTEVQALAEAVGVKIDPSLGAKQAFTALSAEMALQLRNPAGGAGMPGAMSDKDREFLQSMTPSLAQTNEGNKLIIDTARQVAKRDQQIAKMARDYRKANGSLDEGFYEQVQTYGDAHPLFAGKTVPGSPAPSGGGWSIKPIP